MPALENVMYTLFAQEAVGGNPWQILFPVVLIGFLFYFMLIRPERQKQNRHRGLLENLKKNDRVVTAGGIKGIVSAVNRDQQEVTLTIDESTGTKIRVNLSSIAGGEDDADSDQAVK